MSHKLNLLVAYPYMKEDLVKTLSRHNDDIRFVLDSGAFTAWKAGKPIKLDDYCRFIESLPFKPWRYFTLDVIGEPEGTLKNYEIMLKRGFNPVPIFTRGEDISVLDDYYKTSDVVGVGGLVGTRGNKGFVKGIMSKVGDRKVHWLGFTNLNYIRYYKPYMCDSSSWSCGVRFGCMIIYTGKGNFIKLFKKDCMKKPSDKIINIISNNFDEDYRHLSRKVEWINSGKGDRMIEKFLFKSYTLYQYDIFKYFNTKYFIAVASNLQFTGMLNGYLFNKNKGFIK